MVCIQCGAETKVVNSRLQKRLNQVWRRRKCTSCGIIFTTNEVTDYGGSIAVRDHRGTLTPFSRDKLLLSLYASLQHRESAAQDATALSDTVISRILTQSQHSVIDDQNIVNTAYLVLLRFDKVAAVHYEAFHRG
jgi:transcriptional regulator NrdR family protein